MEFVGPGVSKLSADYRIGIDVMTTETTCLSSIWKTDEKIQEFYEIHGRSEGYKELNPGAVTYYDGMVYVNMSEIKPMIDQIEHTPLMHDEKLISFCKENDIQIMAWGPLLRGNLENKKMEEIAEKYNKTTAQLLLRWNIQQGIIPIPKSKNEQRLQHNIDVFDFEITKEDMEELNHMNENHRTSFDPLTFDF